ncbi:UDP-2,3-diacylglucosamine diphosphatase LpxI [Sagittula sp. NFXS13]|uniref:LpxI family protein n=1 Tax=Sagittula sp. NFXS13 TaxID=2819095 RepID=UPI0032DE75F3
MLALIAGRGDLPAAVVAAHDGPVVVCALEGHRPDGVSVDRVFPLEGLGDLLHWLHGRGVTTICFCGAISRPSLSLRRIGWRTWPLVPRVVRALRRGDDGALRIAMRIFEDAGFRMLAAHEAAPSLLPVAGVWGVLPDGFEATARLGDQVSAAQAAADLGQACVLHGATVLAREGEDGTDAMLDRVTDASGGVLYKAPKPGQDRRADLPAIGPGTVHGAAKAGLSGIIVEADGVMVLGQPQVGDALAAAGLFLWIRKRGA